MEQQTVSEGIEIINLLTKSGAATALIFGLVLGLGVAMAAKVPAHIFIERDQLANWVVYMTCIFGAFLACFWLWPDAPWRPKLAFSLSIAFATPLLWVAFVGLVGLIRPNWKKALSLHRINFVDEVDNARNPEPGPDAPKS